MYQYLFTKLIFCSKCNNSYRGILEYETPFYICSSYAKDASCERNRIEESLLVDFVMRYCRLKGIKYEGTKEFMQGIIKCIIVYPDEVFEIQYKDESFACYTDNLIRFI